jgi:signal transduction histidine kinase
VRSLRARLYALWLLLAVSAATTGFVLYQFYVQSAAVQVASAEYAATRACRDLSGRYAFYVSGWRGGEIDDALRAQLTEVARVALGPSPGVEGGYWSGRAGSLAYAFPTYEGTGPKTDLPNAEIGGITQVNADAARDGSPRTVLRTGRSQTLVLHACPLGGPLPEATAWTMARVYSGQGPAYDQLLSGLTVLAATLLISALLLGRIILTNARRIAGLETALAAHEDRDDLPSLPMTGERELDRLVSALNQAGSRLAEARSRVLATERLATIGRMAAGIAHEIRNPMAAMRLKAENALANADPSRRDAALTAILDQVARLDGLLGDLLQMTQPRPPRLAPTDVRHLLDDALLLHRELADEEGVSLRSRCDLPRDEQPLLDGEEVSRAVSNLLLNAIQALAGRGGHVDISASRIARAGRDWLLITVTDDGPGIPGDLRDRIFEPFETTKAAGSGLGLSIVREIARAHGGDVVLAPDAAGTLFVLELPWAPS